MMVLKQFVLGFIPPHLHSIYLRLRQRKIRFIGKNLSWNSAKENSKGYDSQSIIENVARSTSEVIKSTSLAERDSIVFELSNIQFEPATLLALLLAVQGKTKVNVIDFGGALGSGYFQYARKLTGVELCWHVIEQETYVKAGVEVVEPEINAVKFHRDTKDLENVRIDLMIFSSVLQYIEEANLVLLSALKCNPDYVVFDRQPFLLSAEKDEIKIQVNPPSIQDSSYPIRFMSFERLVNIMRTHGYILVNASKSVIENDLNDNNFNYMGAVFERIQG